MVHLWEQQMAVWGLRWEAGRECQTVRKWVPQSATTMVPRSAVARENELGSK